MIFNKEEYLLVFIYTSKKCRKYIIQEKIYRVVPTRSTLSKRKSTPENFLPQSVHRKIIILEPIIIR